MITQGMRRQSRIEQRCPDEQLVQEHPEGIQVGGRPQPTADELFGRHVLRGPDEHARGGRRPVENLRDPEVGDLEQASGVEQNVVGLDVAVQYPLGMRAGQRRGHRQTDRAGTLRWDARPPTGQRPPTQQLHDDQMQLVGLDVIVDPHDMRMIHRGEDPCLGFETAWRVLLRRGQHLDRNIAIKVAVPAR